ncbi:unnamed protein product [Rhizophagus irregularis]|uniref:Uncharacterized protein n=1 Tax=Rhizophagus irregularis TaxID=588596 RepID=A0A2I1HA19_9GLOM|nr:hypothetical protein RhiirA4_475371 [Rhizophagus irregularis]CAB4443813.1 unnamed protein product [Rhizophagus irregularis]
MDIKKDFTPSLDDFKNWDWKQFGCSLLAGLVVSFTLYCCKGIFCGNDRKKQTTEKLSISVVTILFLVNFFFSYYIGKVIEVFTPVGKSLSQQGIGGMIALEFLGTLATIGAEVAIGVVFLVFVCIVDSCSK